MRKRIVKKKQKNSGTFNMGVFEEGIFISKNGHIYEGQFKDNKFHGSGT